MPDLLKKVRSDLRVYANPEKAVSLSRFFKTGKGQYGHGDQFIGVTVPNTRKVARVYGTLSEGEIASLLHSPIHEERLLALLILVEQYQKGDAKIKKQVASTYLKNITHVNNWDLVDLSADKILGDYCQIHDADILFDFARSDDLWKRRIAMVATYHTIKQGDASLALEIATILKDDSHDLIQKAVGWMLREVGKRCGKKIEQEFLDKYAATMPRTMLRYAIEQFNSTEKAHYMGLAKNLKK
ncbi:MAG: DNA alkylation repair protein [Patescibacteria group bacterium]